jgi:hypothetical protein
MNNIWEQVPLEDYEKHMRHETVGQLQLLNELTEKYLKWLTPETIMFLGVSGGNGLEHIDNRVTKKVHGVDINNKYLIETKIRFESRIPNLILSHLDIAHRPVEIARVNLVWAALIFEYVEMSHGFKFINSNIQEVGYVVITIQVNNGVSSISKTGVESVKLIGQIFKPVDSNELLACADEHGFEFIKSEVNGLPNGKTLETFCFRKREK